MTDKNSSSLQSWVDSASGAVQGALGNLTGNTADQAQAEDKKALGESRSEASHTAAKLGPVTVTPSGTATDNSDRTDGSWAQTLGSGKEALGGLLGSESLKQEGMKQNREGKEQEAKGQLADLGQGVGDRVKGTLGGVYAAATGDKTAEERYEKQRGDGKAAQRGVEADLQRQVDAEERAKEAK